MGISSFTPTSHTTHTVSSSLCRDHPPPHCPLRVDFPTWISGQSPFTYPQSLKLDAKIAFTLRLSPDLHFSAFHKAHHKPVEKSEASHLLLLRNQRGILFFVQCTWQCKIPPWFWRSEAELTIEGATESRELLSYIDWVGALQTRKRQTESSSVWAGSSSPDAGWGTEFQLLRER